MGEVDTDSAFAQYERAEAAYLEAIRDRADWSTLTSLAEDLAASAEAVGEVDNTAATELLAALWRDVALAYQGKPSQGY